MHGKVRHGKVTNCNVSEGRQGKGMQGKARNGKATQGNAVSCCAKPKYRAKRKRAAKAKIKSRVLYECSAKPKSPSLFNTKTSILWHYMQMTCR
jgi:hypothetical protein